MVVCILLCSCLAASGQVSVGLTLRSSLNSHSGKTDPPNSVETSGSEFSLDIGPVVRFMVSSKAEVAPYLGFSVDNTSTKVQSGQTSSSENMGMIVGCGLNFFLVENSVFKFSLGPRLHSSFWFTRTETTIGVDMPLNFDVLVAGPWSIRGSASVIDFWYSYSKANAASTNSFQYNMSGLFMPELSFFITF
jgi:hypothetical protein